MLDGSGKVIGKSMPLVATFRGFPLSLFIICNQIAAAQSQNSFQAFELSGDEQVFVGHLYWGEETSYFRLCNSERIFYLNSHVSNEPSVAEFFEKEGIAKSRPVYVAFIGFSLDETFTEGPFEGQVGLRVIAVLAIKRQAPMSCE